MAEPLRIRRLNHAVLFVSDVPRAVSFYEDVLGFETIGTLPDNQGAFLKGAGSDNHHDLGLFSVGADAPRPPRGAVGLYHLAWQVDTIDQLVDARERIVAAGAHVGQSSHGLTKSIYGVDPDGNEFEVLWNLPRSEWGNFADAAFTAALDLEAEVARWSGVATA